MSEISKVTKVLKLPIIKPAGEMSWADLGKLLRDVRYRVFRLANLAVSEAYLNFHLWRTKKTEDYKASTMGQLNRQLRDMLREEGTEVDYLDRFSRTGAIPDYVVSALSSYKLSAVTHKSKWSQVVCGQVSLPVFRGDMPIPVRCDKPTHRRMEKTENGDIHLDLMITRTPYPRVLLGAKDLKGGQLAILNRLLDNMDQSLEGYRQRCFEIKQDKQNGKWWLLVTYDFPLDGGVVEKDVVVGVDLGFSVPMYVALNNGLARLGRRQFQAIGQRVQILRNQTDARRRLIQRSGSLSISNETSRSGHGRKRKLAPTEKLQDKVNKAYTTLNHQLSRAVIDFARNHRAGVIQIEDLSGLKDHLQGTFLGMRWRYHQLQNYLEYKAKEAGMELRKVNAKYTSRRCSECGHIHLEFDRAYRDSASSKGKAAEFCCPECSYKADPDYNAARNIATIDIEAKIRVQCEKQGINY